MDVCAFIAANISVARKDVRQVAMGRTKTDVDTGGENFQNRMTRAQDILRAVFSLEEEGVPNYIFPVVGYTKKEIWNFLPEEVRTNTWYCRHPQYESKDVAIICGQCRTCHEVKEFIS
jgi:7-cyano-7-deazaguanine synthase in queuosine biosynthesis